MSTTRSPERHQLSDDDRFRLVGSACAAVIAVLSVVYAVAYLFVTPSAQRGANVAEFYESYLRHPAGMRLASACLAVSGVLSGIAIVALADSLRSGGRHSAALQWATIAGVGGGLLTAVHGLGGIVELDRMAHRFATGDAVVRATVVTSGSSPSTVDPRGLITFGLAGLVTLALTTVAMRRRPAFGLTGAGYGVSLLVLFIATGLRIDPLVLVAGGLASVVLGPCWWVLVASWLRTASDETAATVSDAASVE